MRLRETRYLNKFKIFRNFDGFPNDLPYQPPPLSTNITLIDLLFLNYYLDKIKDGTTTFKTLKKKLE